jgi:sigma-E factor negative regulatory protein RseC
MKQTGLVVEVVEDKAKIRMQRHTACGDCGACQASESQLKLTIEVENNVGAREGDFVEVDLETLDFLSATIIVYLYPLIAMIVGILGGFYGVTALGFSYNAAQGIAAVLGILAPALTYLVIKLNEDKFKGMKKYKPMITSIISRQ